MVVSIEGWVCRQKMIEVGEIAAGRLGSLLEAQYAKTQGLSRSFGVTSVG
jgi:hypothetical protein